MTPEALAPLLLLGAAVCFLPDAWTRRRSGQRLIVVCTVLLVLRYLHWRFLETVLPADPGTIGGAFVWLVFAIELLAWIDAGILFAFLLSRTNRSLEADWHEDRLREADPATLPEIDVFIATYNEPIEVLEKTISGALALDWPKERLNVWVLDDGRREWLARYARRRGAGYLTRPDNAGAKAGNINAAICNTQAPFFLVLDADFVPQRKFLFRAMGFFQDPAIGIVQIPHNFFNPDPMQSSLEMSKLMPDDQRFFFEAIMPGRDGYDCAFCCGSNGIVRRAALEKIGGALPTGSITEDMLLTMVLKRHGYVTRYLDEKLAYGLAPESINAFFIQRARWARGAIQILFLPEGPLRNPGLALHERIFFLPLHWISQSLSQSLAMVIPAIFLLAGLPPLVGASFDEILSIQAPAILAALVAVRMLAPGAFHPVAATAHSVLQAFRLLPVVLATLIRPHGHSFKVTPKGGEGQVVTDRTTVAVCILIALTTALGLHLNAHFETQIVPLSHMVPVVAVWAIINVAVLMLVAKIAVSPPARRLEQRFDLRQELRVHFADTTRRPAWTRDISLSGALVEMYEAPDATGPGDWICLEIAGVGFVPAKVRRRSSPGARASFGLAFAMPSFEEHADLRPGREARRLELDEPAFLRPDVNADGIPCRIRNVSMTGALVEIAEPTIDLRADEWVLFELASGARVPADTQRIQKDATTDTTRLSLRFNILDPDLRHRLIEKLFTEIRPSGVSCVHGWLIFRQLLLSLFSAGGESAAAVPDRSPQAADLILPNWIQDLLIADLSRRATGHPETARHEAAHLRTRA